MEACDGSACTTSWLQGCCFDQPGWGLTSPPRKNDWEEDQLPNPYKLETQVDLLLSFCLEMGFSSVVLVGHDDGARESRNPKHIQIRGIVLIGVSLSREVILDFAWIVLHTSLGKKDLVWPLLRNKITQVVNRRSWYDATKLTTEVLNLYKVPLCVEGWDEALHEISRLPSETFLSIHKVEILFKSLEDLPVLVVVGAEDALVSLKSSQVMASKLINFIGPIPVDDGRGKEIATLISSTMKTNKTFYTDYNGRYFI
ncbi:hypothetical protein GIB67_020959 [Kingdonia uniflora]|uniref:Uncharacterized protein n=1 Tax=Kingdonia uniflora TaxID=39325 RepID=A0A7J7M7M4_9MAGN|nr:hypothetical protein GIB67_020959 [Kingdonia uniflora]